MVTHLGLSQVEHSIQSCDYLPQGTAPPLSLPSPQRNPCWHWDVHGSRDSSSPGGRSGLRTLTALLTSPRGMQPRLKAHTLRGIVMESPARVRMEITFNLGTLPMLLATPLPMDIRFR